MSEELKTVTVVSSIYTSDQWNYQIMSVHLLKWVFDSFIPYLLPYDGPAVPEASILKSYISVNSVASYILKHRVSPNWEFFRSHSTHSWNSNNHVRVVRITVVQRITYHAGGVGGGERNYSALGSLLSWQSTFKVNSCQVGLKPSILPFTAHLSLVKMRKSWQHPHFHGLWCVDHKDNQQLFRGEGKLMPKAGGRGSRPPVRFSCEWRQSPRFLILTLSPT